FVERSILLHQPAVNEVSECIRVVTTTCLDGYPVPVDEQFGDEKRQRRPILLQRLSTGDSDLADVSADVLHRSDDFSHRHALSTLVRPRVLGVTPVTPDSTAASSHEYGHHTWAFSVALAVDACEDAQDTEFHISTVHFSSSCCLS